MALLPDRQEDQVKVLSLVVLLGLGAMYWLYLHAPRSDELARERDRLEQLEFENRRMEIRAGNLDGIRQELEGGREALRRSERRVPTGDEVSALYDDVARAAGALDLELVSVAPGEPTRPEGEPYLRQRWSMILEGDYHRVGRFLSDVASLDRLVRPTVSTVSEAESGAPGDVRATVQLEAFVRPHGEGTAGTDGVGRDGGG